MHRPRASSRRTLFILTAKYRIRLITRRSILYKLRGVEHAKKNGLSNIRPHLYVRVELLYRRVIIGIHPRTCAFIFEGSCTRSRFGYVSLFFFFFSFFGCAETTSTMIDCNFAGLMTEQKV